MGTYLFRVIAGRRGARTCFSCVLAIVFAVKSQLLGARAHHGKTRIESTAYVLPSNALKFGDAVMI